MLVAITTVPVPVFSMVPLLLSVLANPPGLCIPTLDPLNRRVPRLLNVAPLCKSSRTALTSTVPWLSNTLPNKVRVLDEPVTERVFPTGITTRPPVMDELRLPPQVIPLAAVNVTPLPRTTFLSMLDIPSTVTLRFRVSDPLVKFSPPPLNVMSWKLAVAPVTFKLPALRTTGFVNVCVPPVKLTPVPSIEVVPL